MSEDLGIAGGRELDEALKQLPAKLQANIMRAALRAGAAVLRDEARSQVPVRMGVLRKSIRVTASVNVRQGTVKASVKAGGGRAWYWRFVEFGTAAHKISPKAARALRLAGHVVSNADHPGARANPFMRPAFDAKAAAALAAVAAKIRERLTEQGINVPAPEPADDR